MQINKSYLAAAASIGALVLGVGVATNVHAQKAGVAEAPGLMGVIKDSKGKALDGVAVSARSDDQFFTTSVYTDDKGAYVFPHLAAGHYKIWAQTVGFATERTDAKLDGAHTVRRGLTLKPLADYGSQLTGYEWFNSLPDDTADHKRMKQVLYVACSGCHAVDLALQNKFDEQGWRNIIQGMETTTYNGWEGTADRPADQVGWEGQIIRYHRDELAKYLAEVRGPSSPPLDLKPLPRPTGDAARAVVTEYDLPSPVRPNEASYYYGEDWSQGPSTGMHATVGVHDVLLAPDGNAWITQSRTNFETNRSMIKLDPKTGKMTAYLTTDDAGRRIFFEQIGPDTFGNLWMHNNSSLVRLDTKTATFTNFPLPKVMGGMENSVDTDSKGRAFVNGRAGVVEFDPNATKTPGVAYPGWSQIQQLTPGDGTTYGLAVDADDNPWWSESYVDKIATKDMKTGKVTEFDMRDLGYDGRKALATPADLAFYDSIGAENWSRNSASPLPYAEMPRRMSADKHGDTVWVPEWASDELAEVNIHTHKITYHPLPIHVHPYKTNVDELHNVWVDTSMVDSIFRFTPSTQTWTRFPLPSHGCGSRHMGTATATEAWVPCDQGNKVVRFQFRSAADVQAEQKAAR